MRPTVWQTPAERRRRRAVDAAHRRERRALNAAYPDRIAPLADVAVLRAAQSAALATLPDPKALTRTRNRTRGAGRPAGRRVTRSSAASGDSGDDGPAGPPPLELKLWRHPRFGVCSPNLLRLLTGGDR